MNFPTVRFVCALLATVCFLSYPAAFAGKKSGTLDIYWVDSEGGGSTLIVTPEDESILIDSGNPGGRDSTRIVELARKTAAINSIDHLITTHLHIDHFGGAAEIAQSLPVGIVYDNGVPDRSPDNNPSDTRFPLLIKPYKELKSAGRVVVTPGNQLPLRQSPGRPALSLTFIAARQTFAPTPPHAIPGAPDCASARTKEKDMSDNANSIVSLLRFGHFRFFDGGDLSWNVEAQLVCPTNRVGTVDVFQVNHHGLDVSNNPLLVHAIAPTVSVMNNGPTKGGALEVLRTLRSTPSIQAMYQVHRNIALADDLNAPPDHIANREKACSADYIHLQVSPDTRSFTVRVPSTGHKRVFQSKH